MSKQQVANTILNADNILIFSHVDPDGDAIGSALGLMWALRSIGKQANVSFADPVPVRLRFLPGSEEVAPREPTGDELIVVLDASDPDRLGGPLPPEAMQGREVVNIDHHITNVNFGTVNWVDPSYPATAQMVYYLLPLLGIERPDAKTATCLLTGMVTDTNAFSTSHTTPAIGRWAHQNQYACQTRVQPGRPGIPSGGRRPPTCRRRHARYAYRRSRAYRHSAAA